MLGKAHENRRNERLDGEAAQLSLRCQLSSMIIIQLKINGTVIVNKDYIRFY
jgi:hypothetical protein